MTLEFWRNLSIVWIGLHVFLLTAIPLVIAFFAVRGMNWVLKNAAVGFHKLQYFSGLTRQRTEDYANKVADPVIRTRSKAVGARVAVSRLFRQNREETPS